MIDGCGIYMYKNKINGHMYIGLTNNFRRRYSDHKKAALNPNDKDYNAAIHCAIRKYGLDNFEYIKIEELPDDKELLKNREQYWIKHYNTYEDRQHYNETPGGDCAGEKNRHIGEEHGRALLTEKDVIFCRKEYQKRSRSRDIHNKYFKDKISYSGFIRMWHGKTWKHVMPEVFNYNPHPARYGEKDCRIINELWEDYKEKVNGSFNKFTKTEDCYVGYGTAYRMVHEPEFYKGK